MKYDIIIVGAGPAGLALAQCLLHKYKNILIIDKEAEIGGLHRVIRVPYMGENIFTEHSPRIYSNTYKNFDMLLNEMDTSFEELFTPYNFSIFEIGGQTILSTLTFFEIGCFAVEFSCLIYNKNHGKNITLLQFMNRNNFSKESMDLIDRMARLTDGAGADRFTLYEFLEIFNQQLFYKLYQPRLPNDVGLFKIWYDYLYNSGVVFSLNTSVTKINYNSDTNLVESVSIIDKDNVENTIYADLIFLANPPQSFVSILENSQYEVQNSFTDLSYLKTFSKKTDYMTYISLTFHWDKKLNLGKVYGFPKSQWGLAFIVLSDYMIFNEKMSQTVISCTITFTDTVSSFINKTANESNREEIISEAYRQLKEAFINLEPPTVALLSPEMYYKDGRWETSGKAFISSSNSGLLPFKGAIQNLYNVGTHNGNCMYAFTSLETAVTNSIYLSRLIDDDLKSVYKIKKFTTVRDVIISILLIILIIIIYNIT